MSASSLVPDGGRKARRLTPASRIRQWQSHLLRALTLAALSLSLGVVWPTVALAHTRLERAEPASGAHLAQVPQELRLIFSTAIELAFTRVQLLGPDNAEVALGEARLDCTRIIVAAVRGTLTAGTYTVVWQVAGADGHPIRGRYTFVIAPGAAGLAPAASTDLRGEPAGAVTAPGQEPPPDAHHDPTALPSGEVDSMPSRRSTSRSDGSASRRSSS